VPTSDFPHGPTRKPTQNPLHCGKYYANGRYVPRFLQSFGRLFAGLPGTLTYRQLQGGKLSYRMYHFIKD